MRGDFASVRWFVADVILYEGDEVYGFFDAPRDITIPRALVRDMDTIRHEAEHHIRYVNTGHWGGHLPDGGTICDGSHSVGPH